MKKNIIILLLALTTAVSVSAQPTLRSSYFIERSTMRHKLNPALINEQNYISLPFLSNINFKAQSNLGLTDFFYPLDNGKVGTFLHKDVPSDMVLDDLQNTNVFDQELNFTVLSTGFYSWGGFNTVDLSLRQNSSVAFKKSLFEFLKVGQQGNSTYNMGGNKLFASSYAELAVGHARKINDNITVGAKVKGLFGLGYADGRIDQMDVTMSEDIWSVNMQGSGNVAVLGNSLNNDTNTIKLNGLGGGGLAFDLGITYENLVENLTLSAAVTDLGFMKWKKTSKVNFSGSSEFTGFEDFDIDDVDGSIDKVSDRIKSDLDGITDPQLIPTGKNIATSLYTTFSVGGEYKMFDNKLSAGLLCSVKLGTKVISENTLSVNYRPADWFNMSVTGTASSYGAYWGWYLFLCPNNGVNFFIGSDCMFGSVSPQYLPLNNARMNLSLGLSVPFGRE